MVDASAVVRWQEKKKKKKSRFLFRVLSPGQVRAKAERLSEWENMTDKQKTAVSELEKLKKALTMQVHARSFES